MRKIIFLMRDEIKTAGKGALVKIAPNMPHAFRVRGDTARIFNGYMPVSVEAMIAEPGEDHPTTIHIRTASKPFNVVCSPTRTRKAGSFQ